MEPNQSHLKHKKQAESLPSIRIAVVTVSDTRNDRTDKNGSFLKQEITAKGHELAGLEIIPDEPADILETLDLLIDRGAQVVLFNGGTGLSKRDGTFEAVSRRLVKVIPGFGEIFRVLSYQQIGSSAMLSRATAGIYRETLVFLMPGSPKAVRLAWNDLISKEIEHMVWEIGR